MASYDNIDVKCLFSTLLTHRIKTPFKNTIQVMLCFVCVTEQHYVSIFFIRLWSVRKPLLFDTQNPGISGFSTAHAYK